MHEIRNMYLARMKGETELRAAVAFARDLMAGDPEKFQAGYTADNAAIAAAEVFNVGREEVAAQLANASVRA